VSAALRFGVAALLDRAVPGTSSKMSTSPPVVASTESPCLYVHSVAGPPSSSMHQRNGRASGQDEESPLSPVASDFKAVTTIILGPKPLEDDIPYTTGGLADIEAIAATQGSQISFEAHAPAVFRALRLRSFGIDEAAYFDCMCSKPLSGVQVGSGKSGSYFIFSKDRRLIIKSVRSSEYPFLVRNFSESALKSLNRISHTFHVSEQVRILSAYFDHMASNSYHSLLPRYLGLYKVRVPIINFLTFEASPCLLLSPYFTTYVHIFMCFIDNP
jgi:hypothetical protein